MAFFFLNFESLNLGFNKKTIFYEGMMKIGKKCVKRCKKDCFLLFCCLK